MINWSGQRPASNSVRPLPSTRSREDEKDVWAPAKIRLFIFLKTHFLFGVFWWKSVKTFPSIHFARFPGIVCPLNRSGREREWIKMLKMSRFTWTGSRLTWKKHVGWWNLLDLPADCRTIQRRGQRKGGTRRGETETSCSPLHNTEMKWGSL